MGSLSGVAENTRRGSRASVTRTPGQGDGRTGRLVLTAWYTMTYVDGASLLPGGEGG